MSNWVKFIYDSGEIDKYFDLEKVESFFIRDDSVSVMFNFLSGEQIIIKFNTDKQAYRASHILSKLLDVKEILT